MQVFLQTVGAKTTYSSDDPVPIMVFSQRPVPAHALKADMGLRRTDNLLRMALPRR